MRDILVTIVVMLSLPYIFKQTYWGAIMWIWISVMNPHSQGWGFARTFPFAALIAATTLLAMFLSKEKKTLPTTAPIKVFIIFLLWMGVTTLASIHGPSFNYDQWIKVTKIFGMTLVVMMLLTERKHIEHMIWSVVISIGYYGVKGGIFTVRSGGSDRVWGPAGTFIDGNNEVALAFVMVIPLMYYLALQGKNKWVRYGLYASMFLCALSALGSYSRGALLAIGAMSVMLWLKSKNKVTLGVLFAFAIPLLLALMPPQWFSRIDTIKTYQEDESAMGRINAWKMAWALAKDHFFGGGFQIYDQFVFGLYAPVPSDVHAAHSIYFQVLGEHGFVGLGLYVVLGGVLWRNAGWILRHAGADPELRWAASLAAMIQTSLIGFAVGGAFLSLLYFDVPYYLVAAVVATRALVQARLAEIGG